MVTVAFKYSRIRKTNQKNAKLYYFLLSDYYIPWYSDTSYIHALQIVFILDIDAPLSA